VSNIDWIWFPKSAKPHDLAHLIVGVFQNAEPSITSDAHELDSNEVLREIRPGLEGLGFLVESGKKQQEKIPVPVLFGPRGVAEKWFDVDAYFEQHGFVIEVEAGRAVDNNQFLKDLFEACLMHGVKYLCVAVRRKYGRKNDFDKVVTHFEALYASNRLRLPLEGILVIGY